VSYASTRGDHGLGAFLSGPFSLQTVIVIVAPALTPAQLLDYDRPAPIPALPGAR